MQLDCETPVGKQFIKDQHDVESLIERRYNVTVKTKTNKIEKYDADIYRKDSLIGVCEIKTRPFWNRKDKTPFTLDLLKKNGYLIIFERISTHNKLKPKSAPARVDCTKCETPIAAPAKSKPGPNFFNILIIF